MITRGVTIPNIIATKFTLSIITIATSILLWYLVLSTIQPGTTVWVIFIIWVIMILMTSFINIGADKLLIQASVEESVLKWFSKNGWGSQIGQ